MFCICIGVGALSCTAGSVLLERRGLLVVSLPGCWLQHLVGCLVWLLVCYLDLQINSLPWFWPCCRGAALICKSDGIEVCLQFLVFPALPSLSLKIVLIDDELRSIGALYGINMKWFMWVDPLSIAQHFNISCVLFWVILCKCTWTELYHNYFSGGALVKLLWVALSIFVGDKLRLCSNSIERTFTLSSQESSQLRCILNSELTSPPNKKLISQVQECQTIPPPTSPIQAPMISSAAVEVAPTPTRVTSNSVN